MAKAKKKNPKSHVGDMKDGDTVVIGEETYRLMIKTWDAWGCRKLLPSGEWSDGHYWFKVDTKIAKVVGETIGGGSAGDGGKRSDPVDPLSR